MEEDVQGTLLLFCTRKAWSFGCYQNKKECFIMSELSANMGSKRSKPTIDTRTLVCTAMLCAVAYGVMYASKTIFAFMSVAGFLKFDLKDVVIAIGGFLFGPLNVLFVSVVVSLIEAVTVSTTGPWGLLMNVISTCSFLCPAAYLYKKNRSFQWAVLGLVIGGVFMTGTMMLWNYLVTPIYQGVPRAAVAKMLIPVFLPFNLTKGLMNGALTMLLYKPIVVALRKAHLVPESSSSGQGKKTNTLAVSIVALFLTATAVFLGLVLAKVI